MLLNVKPLINKPKREDKAQEVGRPDGYILTEHHGRRDAQMSKGVFGRKKVLEGKAVGIEDLRVGDAVRVHWFDASEDTRVLSCDDGVYDTPIRSYGAFLGVKGFRARHIVIAKEVVERDKVFHYNAIPVGMVEKVILLNPKDLEERLLKPLRRKVVSTPLKKFVVGVLGGCMPYE